MQRPSTLLLTTQSQGALESSIGYAFEDPFLLQEALTHRSYAQESNRRLRDNERLEFLGDAILGLVLSDNLLRGLPQAREGELSKLRSQLVSEKYLAELARAIGLGRHLLLGRGEEKSGGREKRSILAGAFEALVGAIYLDAGFELCSSVLWELFLTYADGPLEGVELVDFKSRFQEFLQKQGDGRPLYRVVMEHGPAHQKTFEVELRVGGKVLAVGKGSSKKSAEQQAAKKGLALLR